MQISLIEKVNGVLLQNDVIKKHHHDVIAVLAIPALIFNVFKLMRFNFLR